MLKILLPIDGSRDALAAARHALRLVDDGLQAAFVLANVQEPASLYEMVVAHDPEVLDQVRSAAGADLLAPAEALLEEAGVGYESEVAGGHAAQVIVELAERYGCDAIVMGARGLGDPAAGGLGAVAHAVLLHAPVPVTVLRAADADAASAADADAADADR